MPVDGTDVTSQGPLLNSVIPPYLFFFACTTTEQFVEQNKTKQKLNSFSGKSVCRYGFLAHTVVSLVRKGSEDFKLLNLTLVTLNPVDISNLQHQESFFGGGGR